MEFHHTSLGSNELRLLKPQRIDDDRLSFTISHFSRSSARRYTAVSYTWGNDSLTEHIYLNGQRFPVRRNLWSCLYYLGDYKTHEETSWTYLWVDAICIDQTNGSERNEQVRLMDVTYRNATCVSVWLGLIPSTAQYTESHAPVRTFDLDPFDWFDCIQQLANRPYWTRFWVVQEFLLGQDVYLYYGGSRIHWLDFKDILGGKAGSADYNDESFDYSKYACGSWAAWPLVTGRHPDRHPELQQPLCELLIRNCYSECKDPRDRVFALLGLVTSDERKCLQRFLPDYGLSEDDVILIALAHVKQFNMEYDGHDEDRLYLGLGVKCERRKNMLLKAANHYDYFGDIPPNQDIWFYVDHAEDVVEDWISGNQGESSNANGSGRGYSATLSIILLGTIVGALVAFQRYYR